MLKETKAVLNAFGMSVISKAKSLAPRDTGALADSLSYEILDDGESIGIKFNGIDYAQFQDLGVQGAKSSAKAPNSPFKFGSGSGGGMRGAIDKWVVRKGLDGVRDAQGRFIGRKGMVYVISRSIYNTGLRPTLFFTRPFEKERRAMLGKLNKALNNDYENKIKVEIKGDNLIVK